jgi:hypothetical protein
MGQFMDGQGEQENCYFGEQLFRREEATGARSQKINHQKNDHDDRDLLVLR